MWALIEACVSVQVDDPQLVAASIKSADVFSRLIACGAHAITVRPEFAAGLAIDELTLAAMEQFALDVRTSLKSV